MNKKFLIVVVSVIVVLVSGYFIDRSRETTYGEALREFLPEDAKVDEIYVLYFSHDDFREGRITDDELISKIVHEFSDMKLKKTSDKRWGESRYYTILSYDSVDLHMIVSKENVIIRDKYYKVIDENLLEKIFSKVEMKSHFDQYGFYILRVYF